MAIGNCKFINDLKELVREIKEYEGECTAKGNTQGASAFSLARIKLETVMENNGIQRPATINA